MDITLDSPNGTVTLADLNAKLDRLTTQVALLAEQAQYQQMQQEQWFDLQADLTPIAHDIFQRSSNKLAEMQNEVALEDVLRLFTRLLQNTHNIEKTLDQLESVQALLEDAAPLAQDTILRLTIQLGEMERKGYFAFARGGLEIVDRIVTEFSEDDVRQLGENIVLILRTIKEMTQPDIMRMMQRTAHVVGDEPPAEPSALGLLKQMGDPATKRGLAKMLNILRSMGDEVPHRN